VTHPIAEQPLLKAKILATLLKLADDKRDVDLKQPDATQLWELDRHVNDFLFELNVANAIHYEEIGEDGFAPIIICSVSPKTLEHLLDCLASLTGEINLLDERVQSLLKHDPDKLRQDIAQSEQHIAEARDQLQKNPILAPLKKPLDDISLHFESIRKVAENYDDIYRNILKPVQEEGKSGVRATVRWTIIGIVASWLLSNYKDIWALIQVVRGAG
jgi:DNA repair exonuclease SbcCD ATPase subunit